jgi:nitric oxide dioxygenase
MTPNQIELVRASWSKVATTNSEVVGELFYNRLFSIAPEVKPLFHGPMPSQYRKLLSMLSYVISKLNRLEDILDEVAALAKRHVHYGVKPEFFTPVGAALLWTLEQGLGDDWTEETKAAWIECYTILSGAMIQTIQQAERTAA